MAWESPCAASVSVNESGRGSPLTRRGWVLHRLPEMSAVRLRSLGVLLLACSAESARRAAVAAWNCRPPRVGPAPQGPKRGAARRTPAATAGTGGVETPAPAGRGSSTCRKSRPRPRAPPPRSRRCSRTAAAVRRSSRRRADGVIVTRGAGRVRGRHELEGTFSPFGERYFENRSYGFEIEDSGRGGRRQGEVHLSPGGAGQRERRADQLPLLQDLRRRQRVPQQRDHGGGHAARARLHRRAQRARRARAADAATCSSSSSGSSSPATMRRTPTRSRAATRITPTRSATASAKAG